MRSCLTGSQVFAELWQAPELNCQVMRMNFVVQDQAGAVSFRETSEVAEIKKGEPDPSLFVVPANYVEHTPSEVAQTEMALDGEQCPACRIGLLGLADANYQLHSKK